MERVHAAYPPVQRCIGTWIEGILSHGNTECVVKRQRAPRARSIKLFSVGVVSLQNASST